jgi:hypothetical protein
MGRLSSWLVKIFRMIQVAGRVGPKILGASIGARETRWTVRAYRIIRAAIPVVEVLYCTPRK